MFKKLSLIILCLFLVTACGANPTQTVSPSGETIETKPEPTNVPGDTAVIEPTAVPDTVSVPDQPVIPYPVAGEDTQSAQPPVVEAYPLPTTGFEPQAGDDTWTRGVVEIEIANSGLQQMETYPVQVIMHLVGNLPNPCHQLRVVVTPDYTNMRVDVETYSVMDSSQVCTEVVQPLDQLLPLGAFSGGTYTVFLNGEVLGTFDS